MESLRVLVDTDDPCAGCGAPVVVYERAEETDDLVWAVEYVECSGGCVSTTSTVTPRATPARTAARARRRTVA